MKKSFLMMIAAAAFVSCSTSEAIEPDMNDGSLISLKSVTYSVGTETRAPFEGAISATNPLTAFVPSSVTGDYSSLHTTGTMTFNSAIAATYNLSSLSNTSGGESFPAGNQVYLFGVYPATLSWNLTAADADCMFSGKEDVMAAKEVLVKKSEVSAGTFQTLAFKHLLTKLEVKFKVEASAISEVGLIKSVSWVGDKTNASTSLENKVTFTPATEAVAFAQAATAVTELPFYGATEASGVKTYTDVTYVNKAYEPTITSTLQAYAMVTPVDATTAKKDEYFIKVVRDGKTDYIAFDLMKLDGTAFTGSTAGNAFTVVVNYTKDDIKAVATVTDWVENGEYVANTEVN